MGDREGDCLMIGTSCIKKETKYICSRPKGGIVFEEEGFIPGKEHSRKIKAISDGLEVEKDKIEKSISDKLTDNYKLEVLKIIGPALLPGANASLERSRIVRKIQELKLPILKGGKYNKLKTRKYKSKKRKTRRRAR